MLASLPAACAFQDGVLRPVQKLLTARREAAAREAALEEAAAAASAEAAAAEQLVAAVRPKGDSVLSTLWNEVWPHMIHLSESLHSKPHNTFVFVLQPI